MPISDDDLLAVVTHRRLKKNGNCYTYMNTQEYYTLKCLLLVGEMVHDKQYGNFHNINIGALYALTADAFNDTVKSMHDSLIAQGKTDEEIQHDKQTRWLYMVNSSGTANALFKPKPGQLKKIQKRYVQLVFWKVWTFFFNVRFLHSVKSPRAQRVISVSLNDDGLRLVLLWKQNEHRERKPVPERSYD